jgi:hypothetical protein
MDPEALAWAREVLGEPGPYIRKALPGVLLATHSQYVALQQQSGLADASPYGLIWLGMPKALVDSFVGIADVQLYRPKRGRYSLPLVNGVPIIPWRYAKDGTTDLKGVPFGKPVTESRKSLFIPPEIPPELPLGDVGLGDAVVDALSPENRISIDGYGAEIRTLATGHLVGVAAYASNPDALLKGYFGYATLGDDDLLVWDYIEEFRFSPSGVRLRDVSSSKPTFSSGPLQQPTLRPRSRSEKTDHSE